MSITAALRFLCLIAVSVCTAQSALPGSFPSSEAVFFLKPGLAGSHYSELAERLNTIPGA